MQSWSTALLAAKYAEFGRSAVLTVGVTSYPIAAVDHTGGAAVFAGVETILPIAEIMAVDLAALGLAAVSLDGAGLALNGTSWRVQSVQPLPSPAGEADGEYQLQLEAV